MIKKIIQSILVWVFPFLMFAIVFFLFGFVHVLMEKLGIGVDYYFSLKFFLEILIFFIASIIFGNYIIKKTNKLRYTYIIDKEIKIEKITNENIVEKSEKRSYNFSRIFFYYILISIVIFLILCSVGFFINDYLVQFMIMGVAFLIFVGVGLLILIIGISKSKNKRFPLIAFIIFSIIIIYLISLIYNSGPLMD